MATLQVGQTVEIADGRIAIVRYVGQPHFAAGDWVGVELEDDSGKNDGSVQGERYFDCEMGRGMFLRPSAVAVLGQTLPAPAAPPAPKNNGPAKRAASRPSDITTGLSRRSSVAPNAKGLVKRESLNAPSPSPAPRRPSGMLRSPSKSPTKQLTSGGTSNASTPRTGTPPTRPTSTTATRARPSVGGSRMSMGPPAIPASRGPRTSVSSASLQPNAAAARPVGARTSLAPRALSRPGAPRLPSIGSQLSNNQASEDSQQDTSDDGQSLSAPATDSVNAIPPATRSPVLPGISQADTPINSPTFSTRSTTSSSQLRNNVSTIASAKAVEDLETKLRLMGKRRQEDREKLRALEKVQSERDKFESIIQKLQLKYHPQQQEILDLRKQLKESVSKFEEIETIQAEHDSILEMATLDREMAEETAEVLKHELDTLKERFEEVELEVEVLREENTELGGEMSAEDKASQGWIQMERNNERLKEALLRLRDLSQQQEVDLKDEIKTLQQDMKQYKSVKDQCKIFKERLAQSEANVEELRQQLDTALGAEDMIEELTEKNMSMTEQIEELRSIVEDLENLKELNDELEINHIETEKELQADIAFQQGLINEQMRRAAQQKDALEDMDYTIAKFRELVINLQTDLEDMRASHAVTETESEQLNARSRAILDLNMKLQVSAAKTEVKAIDLELRRLDAQQASDHLAIVQLFLPEDYQADRGSILALLRFKRVAFKAQLLHDSLSGKMSGETIDDREEGTFYAFEALDRLTWIASMCSRFVNSISHCSVERFTKMEGAMYELEPVERALNAWIDALRRDELKERQCVDELQRSVALMSHLAEVHISSTLEAFADDVHMRVVLLQSCTETTINALITSKAMVSHVLPVEDEEDESTEHFQRKMDMIISHARSAKVISGKAVRALEDLKTRSLSLPMHTLPSFQQCEDIILGLAKFSRTMGLDLYTLLHEEGRAEPFKYSEVYEIIHRSTTNVFKTTDTDLLTTFASRLRMLTGSLNEVATLSADLSQMEEFERAQAPWVFRAREIAASRNAPVDIEEDLRRLKEDNHEQARMIAMRDQTLEESTIKIELLERRMQDATKKHEAMLDLEKKIAEAARREADLAASIEDRDRAFAVVEADRERWRKIAGDSRSVDVDPTTRLGQERAVATAREMNALKYEISSLQDAVRYLREDSRLARQSEAQNLQWLHEPLIRAKSKNVVRKDLVVTEGNDVLTGLLDLASSARIYDLNSLPENKLAWRPAKETPAYHVARQRQDYTAWKSWQEAVVKKGKALMPRDRNTRVISNNGVPLRGRGKQLAKVQFDTKSLSGETRDVGGEVTIVEPEEFEGFRRRMRFV